MILELNNIDKSFGEKEVLKGVARSFQNVEYRKMLLYKAQVYQYLSGDADNKRI